MLTRNEIAEAVAEGSRLTEPNEVLDWATDRFPGQIVLATALGPQSLLVIDLLHRMGRQVPVVFLDTGLHFEETYALRERVAERYALELRAVEPEQSVEEQARSHGRRLWESDPDRCCLMRKVLPLDGALLGFDAWITGLRRTTGGSRADVATVERDESRSMVKVNPLARWTRAQVFAYLREHEVPYNSLLDEGYPSIGCQPCTRRPGPGADPDDERAGRWSGSGKTECGIHLGLEARRSTRGER